MSRELDAQIDARLMGACGDAGHEWETTPVVELDGSTFGGETWCAKCGRERGLYMTPAYSTDLNACAQAEAQVIGMGLGEKYLRALVHDLRTSHFAPDPVPDAVRRADPSPVDCRAVLTASAEARCRAMLRVVGEGAE